MCDATYVMVAALFLEFANSVCPCGEIFPHATACLTGVSTVTVVFDLYDVNPDGFITRDEMIFLLQQAVVKVIVLSLPACMHACLLHTCLQAFLLRCPGRMLPLSYYARARRRWQPTLSSQGQCMWWITCVWCGAGVSMCVLLTAPGRHG